MPDACRRDLPQEEVVLLVDSNDLLWLPCGRDLWSDFQGFHADIVLNSEEFQFPDRWKQPFFPDVPLVLPDVPFPNDGARNHYLLRKFINAGVIMGRVGALNDIMGRMFWEYGYADNDHFDDQR